MYTKLVSSFLFPLQERLKGHRSVMARRELERTQWWRPDELQTLQLQRLRSLLADVSHSVPYYTDMFARIGFDANDVHTWADLRRLPLLTKALIRANTEALKRKGAGPLVRSNTGGSSGEPLIFFLGQERVSADVAAKWRATRWWGVDFGDRETVVWGSPIELGAQDHVRALRDRLFRSQLLPAFDMSASRLDEFIAAIRRQRPAMLFGYPSALSHIAQHARQRAIDMTDLGIKVAFVTSERLYDDQRDTIARVFNCRVANGYGGRDAGFIAHECPSGSMHITAEDIIVELLDAQGAPVPDGTPGEIVVTHLASRDFPFVRYRTGDVAVRDTAPCACGRGLPVLREIQGRTTDFVVAADGTVMHGLALIYIVRDLAGVQSFKIVQESRQSTTVQLVVDPGFDFAARRGDIVTGFKRRLGASVDIKVERVASIAPEASGKFRYVVSHVSESNRALAHA
jgi:phenylacetate-CoA ligase